MTKQATADDLDLGVEQAGGSKKKLIIMIALGLLLLGGGAAAAYFFLLAPGDAAVAVEEGADGAKDEQPGERGPAIYHDLAPLFVVTLEGHPKLLQLGIQAMSRDPEMIEFLQQYDPLVRDRILSLLMAQQGKQLKSRAAKEALQSALIEEVRKVATEQGAQGRLEALYFTRFVMQ